ncbi:hypothetical protein NECAME_02074 [Necator americanus]|uniref:Uncharacterized protein n=1 Tax=Necator americanus TaxID=51031 RepID=W2TJK4_NECAM|nr:hypothetical protein NECAME_02074 [Necator americanus]ETN81784.1 hypothetical protein NECAME_02074 [Necator americanus]
MLRGVTNETYFSVTVVSDAAANLPYVCTMERVHAMAAKHSLERAPICGHLRWEGQIPFELTLPDLRPLNQVVSEPSTKLVKRNEEEAPSCSCLETVDTTGEAYSRAGTTSAVLITIAISPTNLETDVVLAA